MPLGFGDTDFETIFQGLSESGYTGNLILQTARASDGCHSAAIELYRDMVIKWLAEHG